MRDIMKSAPFRLLVISFGLALAVLPAAAAQAAPTSEILIEVGSGDSTPIRGGMNASVPATVTLTVGNMSCQMGSSFTVTLTVEKGPGTPSSVEAEPSDMELVFDIAPGTYVDAGFFNPYEESMETGINVTVEEGEPGGTNSTLALLGALAAGTPQGCSGSGAVPAAQGRGETDLAIAAARTNATDGENETMNTTGEESPGIDAAVLIVAVLGTAWVAARRRDE